MRATLRTALVVGLTAITISGPALAATASPTTAAAPAAAAPAAATTSSTVRSAYSGRPAFSGRENFAIVSLNAGSRHPRVFAKGAFHAIGKLDRGRVSTVAFPRGRVLYRHQVISTIVSDPNLRTCRFTEQQTGTFWVVRATGRYAGMHYSGIYRTTITARLKRGAQSGCGSTFVRFRELTYFKGDVS
jgi:hypothetical protein